MTNDPLAAADSLNDAMATLANTVSQYEAQKWNREKYEEYLTYMKDLQNRIFSREDSAVQRRMADLRVAGINPLMAAGSAAGTGSAQAISPYRSMDSIQTKGTNLTEAYMRSAQMDMMQEQVYHMNKQNDLLDAQVKTAKADARLRGVEASIKEHDYDILNKTNILSTSSGFAKDVADLVNNVLIHRDAFIEKMNDFFRNPGKIGEDAVQAAGKAFKESVDELIETSSVGKVKTRIEDYVNSSVEKTKEHLGDIRDRITGRKTVNSRSHGGGGKGF